MKAQKLAPRIPTKKTAYKPNPYGWGIWDNWNDRPRNSFAKKPVKKIKSAKKREKVIYSQKAARQGKGQKEMEDTTLTRSEIEEAQSLMTDQKVTVVKTGKTFGQHLLANVLYRGDGFVVYRRKVDEIDNLYLERQR